MELVRFPARHVPNPRAARDAPYGPCQSEVIDRGGVVAALDSGLREAIGLDDDARVIAIGSEGATDPETFERVVGRPWEEVRE